MMRSPVSQRSSSDALLSPASSSSTTTSLSRNNTHGTNPNTTTTSGGTSRNDPATTPDFKSVASYKSTQSSRSSVLERAREYNRRIEDNHHQQLATTATTTTTPTRDDDDKDETTRDRRGPQPQPTSGRNRPVMTREQRAMAMVEHDTRQAARKNATTTAMDHHVEDDDAALSPPSYPKRRTDPSGGPDTTPKSQHPSNTERRLAPTPRRTGLPNQESQQDHDEQDEGHPVVTPELLVDALSGHEDGLLAIAERLMEHYDQGYDVMGEAIIDAFADVQKLFQHVVEAAHMEGAAFEASRREEEMEELRKKGVAVDEPVPGPSPTSTGPSRHEEYIDPDVKETLTEAIRKGAPLRQADKHAECFQMFETACQSASAMLPVDSDHRGRLQLSIARAESMSPDRACAILRYAMDDVLRSGLRPGRGASLPDPSKRGDCVLVKPKEHPSLGRSSTQAGVAQSSEEELASLVEEMKEVLGAPVYDNTPLQSVAERFWKALNDAQRNQMKSEEKLEQNLGKLKGEYLLAKAEWEEKLTDAQESADTFKQKYMKLRKARNEEFMDQARAGMSNLSVPSSDFDKDLLSETFDSSRGSRGPGSVATSVSGLAQHAKSLVGSFACAGANERTSRVVEQELGDSRERRRSASVPRSPGIYSTGSDQARVPSRGRTNGSRTPNPSGTPNRSRTPNRTSPRPTSRRSTPTSNSRSFQEV